MGENEKYADPALYEIYISRINAVLDYIETHLCEALTLEELSRVANFSRFHFHRIFGAFMGEPLSQFIWRLRLEKAATVLVNDPQKTLSEIALDCGFANSSSFSRSFKNHFKLSPLRWKRAKLAKSKPGEKRNNLEQNDSNPRPETPSSNIYNRSVKIFLRRMSMGKKSDSVVIRELPETTVVYVRYIGPYEGDEKLFETLFGKLCSWAGPRNLLESDAQFLVIYHDNPEITEKEKLRMSVCLTVPEDTKVEGDIGKLVIPAGEYAVARFKLDSTEYAQAWNWIYSQWLPQSGYVPDDRPSFELYPNDVESEIDGKRVVDIYTPIRKI